MRDAIDAGLTWLENRWEEDVLGTYDRYAAAATRLLYASRAPD